MATTLYPVNHPLAVKLWSKVLYHEALKETQARSFMGKGSDSGIVIKDETAKSAGDKITYGLRMQLSNAGVSGDSTLEGQEEALATYSDSVMIDQLRNAVRSAGKMSEQRVTFSVREEAMMGLRDWWADRIDTSWINQIAGLSTQTDTKYTGMQSATAPSTTTGNSRIVYGPVSTTENSLSAESASANFQLTVIDKAITLAKTATPLIRPLRINGQEKYAIILHPYQVYSMRIDATANRVTWYDAQKALVTGGDKNNAIFTGALGEYNGCLIYQNNRIPAAGAVTTARRAVFFGAQAACMAVGRDNADTQMNWKEDSFDYGNQLGVSAGMIWGLKKSVYNAIDFGTIVISTHAESP